MHHGGNQLWLLFSAAFNQVNTVLEITLASAIFRPISAFGRPKSILIYHISCTFSMGQQSVTCIISYFQKNGQPISDPYF